MAVGSLALSGAARAAEVPDVTFGIAPYTLEASLSSSVVQSLFRRGS
jgi:hypothetical protein